MSALPRLTVLSSAFVCVVMLAGCSDDSEMIDFIKNSKSQTDALDVGAMLENTKVCSNPKWSYKETKRGEHYVLFECTPNVDLSAVRKSNETIAANNVTVLKANIDAYRKRIKHYQKEVDAVSARLQQARTEFESFKKTDLANSMPVFFYKRLGGGNTQIQFYLTLFNLSPELWNEVFAFVKANRYDSSKLQRYVRDLGKTKGVYAMSVASNWDIKEIEAYETLFELPKGQCFDAWKNSVLPKLDQYRYVKQTLRTAYRKVSSNFEKLISRFEYELKRPAREVQKFTQFAAQDQAKLDNWQNRNWMQLKDATLYVRFNVDPDKKEIIAPRGSRSGYVLRWEDGTESNLYGVQKLAPMDLEAAAEKDDVRRLGYWLSGLSDGSTLKIFYQQGGKSAEADK